MTRLKRGLLGATALLSGVTLLAGQAFAAQSREAAQPAPPDAALRDQVQALSDLVRSMSERDQAQIEALKRQVDALQAQIAQQPVSQQPVAQQNAAALTAASARRQDASNPPNPLGLPRVVQNSSGGEPSANSAPAAEPSAQAYAAESPGGPAGLPRVVQNSSHRLSLQSADGKYSIGLTGDVQFDTGDYFSFRPDSHYVGPQTLSNGVNARRARIGVAGTAFGSFGFGLVYDTGNSSDATPKGIETAQIVYGGLKGVAIELGYSNTFFTLDQSTGSNDTLFLERASPSNIATNFNAGDARSNAGVRLFGDRYWVGGYLTGPASGDSHTQTAERLGAFERAAFQVLNAKDYTLHLGFDADQLLQAPNAGPGTVDSLSLSDSPELRIDPTALVSTGALGVTGHPTTGGHVYDLETAATLQNFMVQAELYRYDVERRGLAEADFGGLYGQASWVITGERHIYNPQAASYFRISPRHSFSLNGSGLGAIEIAARVSYVDLDSNFRTGYPLAVQPSAIDGGRQTGYTLGLNWYPNDLFRFLLDYNHIDYSKANGTAVTGAGLGAAVGTQFDALSLRAQVAF